ncbi:MAG: retropepsin-like aspartic protease family protein [Halocynthiibacter sp.]
MQGDDFARLAYLALLGVAIGGWFFAESRKNVGQSMRYAMVWGLIFIGVIAAIGLWQDIKRDVLPSQSINGQIVTIPRGDDGHYHIRLNIDGTSVPFVIDTGASDVVITMDTAEMLGFKPADLRFTGFASTANGLVRTARITLKEVRLGGIHDARVGASVNEGDLFDNLLGMSYLERYQSIEIRGGEMVLTR